MHFFVHHNLDDKGGGASLDRYCVLTYLVERERE